MAKTPNDQRRFPLRVVRDIDSPSLEEGKGDAVTRTQESRKEQKATSTSKDRPKRYQRAERKKREVIEKRTPPDTSTDHQQEGYSEEGLSQQDSPSGPRGKSRGAETVFPPSSISETSDHPVPADPMAEVLREVRLMRTQLDRQDKLIKELLLRIGAIEASTFYVTLDTTRLLELLRQEEASQAGED